jgi:hypothetical protein
MIIYEQPDFIKGMNYAGFDREVFAIPESDESIDHLAGTGVNWIAVNLFWYQDSRSATSIQRDENNTVSDESLLHLIDYVHQKGMKVLLKPMVDARDGTWRGRFFPINWEQWFKQYGHFIGHYAKIAEEKEVEMLCVGCEFPMYDVVLQESWKNIIAQVRELYSGPLTYAANHSRRGIFKNIDFWEDLDYIGINAYFGVSGRKKNSVRRMRKGWKRIIRRLEKWFEKSGLSKPVLFTELGATSVNGGARKPWLFDRAQATDWEEQANYYEAFFNSFEDIEWLAGVFWWWWDNPSTQDYIKQENGEYVGYYTPKSKDAEAILREYWGVKKEEEA